MVALHAIATVTVLAWCAADVAAVGVLNGCAMDGTVLHSCSAWGGDASHVMDLTGLGITAIAPGCFAALQPGNVTTL